MRARDVLKKYPCRLLNENEIIKKGDICLDKRRFFGYTTRCCHYVNYSIGRLYSVRNGYFLNYLMYRPTYTTPKGNQCILRKNK